MADHAGLLSDANRDVQKALSIDPTLTKCWQRAAKINILLGNADVALEAAIKALTLLPNDNDSKEVTHTQFLSAPHLCNSVADTKTVWWLLVMVAFIRWWLVHVPRPHNS
jgi:tetratricopeptide (TPR) repeat protein